MTFAMWHSRYDFYYVDKGMGYLIAYTQRGQLGYADVFNLTDYVVSSVSGPCVYLVPRV